MVRSDEIIGLVMDDDFAGELYCALTNMMWLKLPTDEDKCFEALAKTVSWDESWTASFRVAGGIVADLRNPVLRKRGEELECYMSWYCSGCTVDGVSYGEGYVSPRVKKILNSMGWYNFEYKD